MKSNSTHFLKLLSVGTVAAFIAATVVLTKVEARSEPAENAVSRSLYVKHCASCHGNDGRSNTTRGRETEADDITGGVSTAKTIRVVTNGRGDMPGFKRKLTAAQIASIARYVATL
ncbi:MAG TPA: cytochrome c [Pyrinomonadaceae bacterium]|nr:cytochrome c [Pyrinomonadaceae bacterium]